MKKDSEVRANADLDTPAKPRDIGPLEALWVFFSSMKTAIVLLLILAAASVVGTVIEQNQPEQAYAHAYGYRWYAVIKAFRLTDVYHSTWFTVLMSLIGLNLLVCSINRFGTAWRRTFRPDVESRPDRVMQMSRSQVINARFGVEDSASRAATALRHGGYHVLKHSVGGGVSLHASRGRVSIWGPYLTHVSILVIFAGAVIGGLTGFGGYTMVTEGTSVSEFMPKDSQQAKDLGFSVGLRKFTIEHDQSRNPTGYKSDLVVYDGGRQVAHKVIDVNHPLSYKGVTFYQSDYGLSELVLKVTGPNGKSVSVPFQLGIQETAQGRVYGVAGEMWKLARFGDKKIAVFPHGLVPDYDAGKHDNVSSLPLNPAVNVMLNEQFPENKELSGWKQLGWLTESKSASRNGYSVTVEGFKKNTVLQVSSNPALPVIYSGFALMVIGVFVSFYVSHRVMRVSVTPASKGATVVAGAQSRAEMETFDRDFERLREALA